MILWLTLIACAVVPLAWWGRRLAQDPLAYFAASRGAGPFLAGMAGTAAGLSAFVFIGGPGLFASIGVASLWLILSAPLTGALQCLAVGEPIVDLTKKHHCITIPDILAARFGEGWPRGLAALVICIGGVTTLGVQIKGSTLLGQAFLDVPGWMVATVAVTVTTIYTSAGGMRIGLHAEAAQGVIMAVAALVLTASVLMAVGGPAQAAEIIQRVRPEFLQALPPGRGSHYLSLFLLFALGTCAQPHYLQKFLMLKDRRSLRWLPAVSTAALLSVLTVWIGLGLGGTALWLGGEINPPFPDLLTPTLLSKFAGPVLLPIATVAILAAIMSTAASLLNMVAAAVTRDLPLAFGRKPFPTLGPARAATIGAAACAGLIAIQAKHTVALLGILGWSMFTAGLLPVIVLGLRWPSASRKGAIIALIAGPLVQIALEISNIATHSRGRWEPGLTGAAVGGILLVLFSRKNGRSA